MLGFMLSFVCCLTLLFAQQAASTSIQERVLPIIVHAKKSPVASLQLGELALQENGTPVKLLALSQRNAEQPMLWIVVLDTSNSQHEDFERTRNAAIAIVKSLPITDRFIAITFDTVSQVSQGQTQDETLKVLRDARAGGGTAFYDALAMAGDLAHRVPSTPGGKVMLLFTDGDDNQSRIFFDDAVGRLQRSDVTTLGLLLNGINNADHGSRLLLQLAESTGGALTSFKNEADAVKAITLWQNVLRHRVLLTYENAIPNSQGKHRSLHLTTVRKDLRLLYPKQQMD